MRHANHVVLPTIITETGDYLTRGGEVVNITSIVPYSAYGATGTYHCNIIDHWDVSGRLYPNMISDNDIVERV